MELQGFFSEFWNVLIPPILILPSITSRIHYSQTLNSIGWHHSSNQRNLLHFLLFYAHSYKTTNLAEILTPKSSCARVCRFFLFSKKPWKSQVLFLTWDLQGFFSDFENVLIPQNLILPSIISWTPPLQNLKKNLENPRYFFLYLGFARFFFSDFRNVLIPPNLILPSITSRIHYFQKKTLKIPVTCFLSWDL